MYMNNYERIELYGRCNPRWEGTGIYTFYERERRTRILEKRKRISKREDMQGLKSIYPAFQKSVQKIAKKVSNSISKKVTVNMPSGGKYILIYPPKF